MNQSNLNIDKILKASLEHYEPSVTFEDIWDKYSKNKGPVLVYRRIGVLVAAVLVLVISIKITSNMTGTSNHSASSIKMQVALNEPNKSTENKGQNDIKPKRENRIALFSQADQNSAPKKYESKARTYSKAKAEPDMKVEPNAKILPKVKTTPKAKVQPRIHNKPKAKEEPSMKTSPESNKKSIMMAQAKTIEEPKANIFRETDLNRSEKAAADTTTQPAVAMGKISPKTENSPITAYVIWENQNYYKTEDVVDEKDIGENLGIITLQTTDPSYNLESNGFSTGTELYEIKGEDTKTAIAIKVGNIYYRAVFKSN